MDNKCKDCKYFVQHYVILYSARFVTTDCGHCVKRKADTKIKRASDNACGLWASNEESRKRLEERIDYSIREFAKQLYHIAQIKKAD